MRLIVLLLAVGVPAFAADRFVDGGAPAADDAGPGTAERPFRTICAATRDLHPGDTIRVRGGIYREAVELRADGTAEQPIALVAEPGLPVVLTGADLLEGLHRDDDGRWSVAWSHRFAGPHPDDNYHRLIGRAEQVFVERYPLTQVATPGQVVPGTFCADLDAGRLWLRPLGDRDLAAHGMDAVRVEASTRPCPLLVAGAWNRVRGIRVRCAANIAQHGMAEISGAHAQIEDCVFERANGPGAVFAGPDIEARRCTFADNGQLGFGAHDAHRLHLVDCVVRGNNTKDFSRGWEAGGSKCCLSRGVVYERCVFEANRGVGAWFDIGNEDPEVRSCLIAENEDAGLYIEIGFRLRAHDNVLIGNGWAASPGAWGVDGGISVYCSPGCVIERNLVVGNRSGFSFRDQLERSTGRIGSPDVECWMWDHDETVRANLLALNRDAQLAGWFDDADEREWPKAQRDAKALARATAPKGVAATDGSPVPTALEELALTVDANAYLAAPGDVLIAWGCPWRRRAQYPSLDVVRAQLGFERGGIALADLPFADPIARDFRLPADHPALTRGCYPRGDVPGVRLGAR